MNELAAYLLHILWHKSNILSTASPLFKEFKKGREDRICKNFKKGEAQKLKNKLKKRRKLVRNKDRAT